MLRDYYYVLQRTFLTYGYSLYINNIIILKGLAYSYIYIARSLQKSLLGINKE
jgi:hypothetical protein